MTTSFCDALCEIWLLLVLKDWLLSSASPYPYAAAAAVTAAAALALLIPRSLRAFRSPALAAAVLALALLCGAVSYASWTSSSRSFAVAIGLVSMVPLAGQFLRRRSSPTPADRPSSAVWNRPVITGGPAVAVIGVGMWALVQCASRAAACESPCWIGYGLGSETAVHKAASVCGSPISTEWGILNEAVLCLLVLCIAGRLVGRSTGPSKGSSWSLGDSAARSASLFLLAGIAVGCVDRRLNLVSTNQSDAWALCAATAAADVGIYSSPGRAPRYPLGRRMVAAFGVTSLVMLTIVGLAWSFSSPYGGAATPPRFADFVALGRISDSVVEGVVASQDPGLGRLRGNAWRHAHDDLRAYLRTGELVHSGIACQLAARLRRGGGTPLGGWAADESAAVVLGTSLTNQRLLELYLNCADYGNGRIGIVQASRFYCRSAPDRLALSDGALLAAAILHPGTQGDPVSLTDERERVLARIMLAFPGRHSEVDVGVANSTPCGLSPGDDSGLRGSHSSVSAEFRSKLDVLQGIRLGGRGRQPKRIWSWYHGLNIRQRTAVDCGPSALATLLAYVGRPIARSRLIEAIQNGVDRRTTIAELAAECRRHAVNAQICRPDRVDELLDYVEKADRPALTVVRARGTEHFVDVIARVGGFVLLSDPFRGNTIVSRKEFERIWLNETLLLNTGPSLSNLDTHRT